MSADRMSELLSNKVFFPCQEEKPVKDETNGNHANGYLLNLLPSVFCRHPFSGYAFYKRKPKH